MTRDRRCEFCESISSDTAVCSVCGQIVCETCHSTAPDGEVVCHECGCAIWGPGDGELPRVKRKRDQGPDNE